MISFLIEHTLSYLGLSAHQHPLWLRMKTLTTSSHSLPYFCAPAPFHQHTTFGFGGGRQFQWAHYALSERAILPVQQGLDNCTLAFLFLISTNFAKNSQLTFLCRSVSFSRYKIVSEIAFGLIFSFLFRIYVPLYLELSAHIRMPFSYIAKCFAPFYTRIHPN